MNAKLTHYVASQDIALSYSIWYTESTDLEYTPLSGVYVVIKCGRDGDMIDDQINDIIDMVGEESIRLIITHVDVESKKDGFNVEDIKNSVSRLAGINMEHIAVVGLESTATEMEEFIHSTLLPEPRKIELKTEDISRLAFRSQQSRRVAKQIREVYDKIDAAQHHCQELAEVEKSYNTDVQIMDIQHAMSALVQQDKEAIFRGAMTTLTPDEQTVCYAQAGLHSQQG